MVRGDASLGIDRSVNLLIGLVIFFQSTAIASADELIELTVMLDEGGRYSTRQFCEESNRKLGTHYVLDKIPDRQVELTTLERAALALAEEADLIHVRFERNRMVFAVPNPEDDRTRHRNRQRLERILKVRLDEWPADKGLHLPAELDPNARTILVIHGLESHAEELGRFADACAHWDIQTILFDYPNDGPLAWSGERLSEELRALSKKYPSLRVAIVAHSMGGLVARYALEIPGKNPGCVTDLFTLGTPHQGTAFGDAQPWMELVYESFSIKVKWFETLCDGLGEAGDDLHPSSAFLKSLNSKKRPPGVRYYAIAGRKSFVAESKRRAIEEELQALLDGRRAPKELRRAVLGIMQAPELRDGRGDGAVTLDSALMPGADDQRVFDLNHQQLLYLPGDKPEDCEVFRWIVVTLNWKRL